MNPAPLLLSCSVLDREVQYLAGQYWPECQMETVSSDLHMVPQRLSALLSETLMNRILSGRPVVLVFGECCTAMEELSAIPGVARVRGRDCPEILLGRDAYRSAMQAGEFFLLPEWARRWEEIFTRRLGLAHGPAAELLRDVHSRLVYLDTGLAPVPREELTACTQWCGLPHTIRPVNLDLVRMSLDEALRTACLTFQGGSP